MLYSYDLICFNYNLNFKTLKALKESRRETEKEAAHQYGVVW